MSIYSAKCSKCGGTINVQKDSYNSRTQVMVGRPVTTYWHFVCPPKDTKVLGVSVFSLGRLFRNK